MIDDDDLYADDRTALEREVDDYADGVDDAIELRGLTDRRAA